MQPTIQWYPGHMAKAKREVAEFARLADVIVEMLDARIPMASANWDLRDLLSTRPRVVVLNKADLADPGVTARWLQYFRNERAESVALEAVSGKGVRAVVGAVERLFAPKQSQLLAKGRLPRAARAMVIGIPNVGKSSLINRLMGRAKAQVGPKPGVTRQVSWVRVKGADLELLDAPGILMPKLGDERVGRMLAAVGSIRDEVYRVDDVAGWLLGELAAVDAEAVRARYQLQHLLDDGAANLETVGRVRGLLRHGGVVDLEKAAMHVLQDFRGGRIGRFTLEQPPGAMLPR